MAGDRPFYAPDHTPEARRPTAGVELWRLQNGSRVLTCEIRNDERASAAVDVQLLEGGELLVATRCVTADGARYVANAYKQDHLRQGWSESE